MTYIFGFYSVLHSRFTPSSYTRNLYPRPPSVTYIYNLHLRLITTTNLIMSLISLYPPVPWNADAKRLIKEIFTILEENSTIRKSIWPWQRENSGGKLKISHFKALAQKIFQSDQQIKDLLK